MYIDSFTKSLTLGDDSISLGCNPGRRAMRSGKNLASAGVRSAKRIGVKIRSMRNAPDANLGFDYLMSNPRVYLHGDDQLDGWLTDLTKPVSKVVRGVSSAALNLTRTGIRATAPAVVSALTGKPIQGTATAADVNAALQQGFAPPQDKTMLYVGIGGAALLGAILFTGRKR